LTIVSKRLSVLFEKGISRNVKGQTSLDVLDVLTYTEPKATTDWSNSGKKESTLARCCVSRLD